MPSSEALPPDVPLLFLPDFFLGNYLREVTGREMDVWLGECHVHAGLTPDAVAAKRQEHRDAEFLVHPECGCVSNTLYSIATGDIARDRTHIVSTEQMMERARRSPARRFVVATETGVLHRLRRGNPEKDFFSGAGGGESRSMKNITPGERAEFPPDLKYRVTVPPAVATRARRAIDRMLAIG